MIAEHSGEDSSQEDRRSFSGKLTLEGEKREVAVHLKYETFVTNKFADHGKRDQSSAPVRDPQSRKEPDPCNVS